MYRTHALRLGALIVLASLAAACAAQSGTAGTIPDTSSTSVETPNTPISTPDDVVGPSTVEGTTTFLEQWTPTPTAPRVAPRIPTGSNQQPPPTIPPTSPGTTVPVWTVTCADGTRHEFDHSPSWEEMETSCGFRPPVPTTTTTLPPRPRVVSIIATYGAGVHWLSGGLATTETCPQSTIITYAITTDDGLVTNGSVPISATSREAVVTLASGRQVTFTYYLDPSGACIKGIVK